VHYLCDGLKLHSYPLASLANSRSRVDLSPDGAAAWVFRHSLDVLKWDSGDRVVITLGNVWASFDTDDLSRCKLYCILEGVPEDFWKRTDDNTDCLRWILSYFLLPMYVSPHCRTQKLSLCIKWRCCLSYFIMSAMAFGYFSASNRLSFLFEVESSKNQMTLCVVIFDFRCIYTKLAKLLCRLLTKFGLGSTNDHAFVRGECFSVSNQRILEVCIYSRISDHGGRCVSSCAAF